ncbi:MAG: nitrous oxide reductase accessory protein NosL [Nitrospirota bacterium]
MKRKKGKKMKKWLIIIGLVFIMAAPSQAISEEICPICNMDTAKSQTKFYVTIEGKKIPTCSARCMYELVFIKHKVTFQDRENPILQSIEVMDFQSKKMFNAMTGFFLVGSDVIPKGSMEPYALGFSTLERANKFWEKHTKPGARIVNFESLTHEVIGILRAEGKLPQKEAPMEQIEMFMKGKQ